MPRLLVSKAGVVLKESVFPGVDILTIGRAPTNDLVLADPVRRVSRYHAAIVRASTSQRYFLRDLSSLRGTRVNGELIHQRLLQDGDVIGIADYELTYYTHSAERASWSRLRVVPKSAEPDVSDGSTVLFTHPDVLMHALSAPGKSEIAEEVLRRAARAASLADLLEQIMPSLVRGLGADRGFAAVFTEQEGYEEVGATGLKPDEQIDISEPTFLEYMREGKVLLDGLTALVPIFRENQVVGFFCLDRTSPASPFVPEEIDFLCTLGRVAAARLSQAQGQRSAAGEESPLEWSLEIVGKSKPMVRLLEEIREAARSGANVLVMGESGSGKELVARAIHALSSCARGKFVAQNCAKLTESLAEAELFGWAPKSGIAGADERGRPGWFEMADGGTLFLDEIQALGLTAQDKLLRVLEEKVVWRIGGKEPIPVAVRIIAATDQDLESAIQRGTFRAPLYYRFGKQIRLVPLRERIEDIPLLAHYFLDRFAARCNWRARGLSHQALQRLMSFNWPGNVRQLQNLIEDAASRNPTKEVLLSWDFAWPEQRPQEVPHAQSLSGAAAAACSGPRPMQEIEKEQILEALQATQGNITKAAKLLGYKSRQTMLNKMDKYGIPRRRGSPGVET